jgi:hypothetical protein
MFSRKHRKPQTETYRFSATPTLSDFLLLIGEMLHLSDLRSERQDSRRSPFQRIRSQSGTLDFPFVRGTGAPVTTAAYPRADI